MLHNPFISVWQTVLVHANSASGGRICATVVPIPQHAPSDKYRETHKESASLMLLGLNLPLLASALLRIK